MVIAGTGRVTGNLVAGYLAKISLSLLYSYAMALCVLAAVIVGYGLRQWDMRHAYDAEETKTDPDESEEEPPETSSLLGRPE
jgi:hypothetical protein